FIPNKTWSEQNPGPGIPTPEVESKYGNIKIEKKDPVNDLMLAGAVFEVYLDPTPRDQVCSAADVSGDPIASGTTGADGTYTFTGLQASNWYDGAAVTDPKDWISYCLLETKAPAGYNLEASPYYITIDWATGTVDAPAYTTAVVNNEKTNLDNELPLTGGQGIAALSILGLALIGGGTAAYAASQRKRA
ncbi:MAG: SpaH/EbpB family LPXTG-anchored major pilin, partial [Brooklawnia sp.]